jgi:hypothetical protein
MNIFILGTGRTGTVTFIKACKHIKNFTCAHESRTKLLGDERLNFPENHIEADNRLSWFLGKLGQKYKNSAFYVHLTRDPIKIAKSYNERWHFKDGIVSAYTHGILRRKEEKDIRCCIDFVESVNANISYFLRDKDYKMKFHLEKAKEDFTRFWDQIGAEGDLEKALHEWDIRYNVSSQRKFFSLFK